MAHQRKRLGELLLETGRLNAQQLDDALGEQKARGCRLGTVLVSRGILTEDMLAKFLSYQLDVPSVNLGEVTVPPEVRERVPRELQEKHLAVPIAMAKEGKRDVLVLAMADPTDFSALDEIGFVTGCKVNAVVATEGAVRRHLGLKGGEANPAVGATVDEESIPGFQQGSNVEPRAATAGLGAESGMERGRIGEQIIDLGEDASAGMVGGGGNPLDEQFLGTEGSVASLPDAPPAGGGPQPVAQPIAQPVAQPIAVPEPIDLGEPSVPAVPEGAAEPFDPLGEPVVGTPIEPDGVAPLDEQTDVDNTEPEFELPKPPMAAAGAPPTVSGSAAVSPSAEPVAEISLGEPQAGDALPDPVELNEPRSNGAAPGAAPDEVDTQVSGSPFDAVDQVIAEAAVDEAAVDITEPGEVTTVPSDMQDPAGSGDFSVPPDLVGDEPEPTVPEMTPADEVSTASQIRRVRDSQQQAAVIAEPAPTPAPELADPAVAEAPAAPGAEVAEPADTAPPGAADARIVKKLKLLEAVAEVLIEKGLITQQEIRDHLRKKAGSDSESND